MHFVTFILEKDGVKSSQKIINMSTYFENLTIKFHILYIFNTYVKFRINQIFFCYFIHKLILYIYIYMFIYIILYHKNMKFKHLIDEIFNDL